ncbi:TPA: carboxypeptidase regulatory-like domain-containing protein, partial [Staphylococcus aureus]|nr:carboxypeptidase regulatory-like domain-containing protein [Staphylococcus aureus]
MLNREKKTAMTRKGMVSNRLNKFSIRKYTVGTASILVGTTLVFGIGSQEAKAAESKNTESTNQNKLSGESESETANTNIDESKIDENKEKVTIDNNKQNNTESKINEEDSSKNQDKISSEISNSKNKIETPNNNQYDVKEQDKEVSQSQTAISNLGNQVIDGANSEEPVNSSKEDLQNKVEKTKEVLRGEDITNQSTAQPHTLSPNLEPKRLNAKMRFAVELPPSVAPKNVNNLITVIKQNITEGGTKDGIISAHDGEDIQYDTEFTIDNEVKSGDSMTVNYDKNVIPSDLTDKDLPVDIIDPSGEVIATGIYDKNTKQIKYTFTEYVNKYENVKARLTLYSFIDKKEVPNETDLNLSFSTANNSISKNVKVDYQSPMVHGNSNIQSIFTKLDEENQTIEQTIYVNPLSKNAQNAKVVIAGNEVDSNGDFVYGKGNTTIDSNTDISIYKVDSSRQLPQSNRIYDYSIFDDVTNQTNINKTYGNNQASIDFGNITTPYIIKVVSKYTPDSEGDLQITQGVRMQTTNSIGNYDYAGYSNFIVSTIDQSGGDGIIKPEEKFYKIGDYVWEDANKDGIQGRDENPISNVLVTLTYPDGTTKSVRTDSNGHYEFGGLTDKETYKVSFTTPNGYLPTIKNASNDYELDSNGESVTVTINGKDDLSLDSGFYKLPKYNLGDYVWEDTNKNGIQDQDEKGISGVTVTLKDENDKVIKTVTTDADGKYKFTDLDNGNYKVEFTTPEGYTPTTVTSGNDTEKDSNGLTTTGVINGADNMTLDSGFYKTPKYNLGNYVWEDTNKDGKQDSTEKGISGVTVTLKNENGEVLQTTKTDKDGKYQFTGLENGTYKVEFETPSGYTPTQVGSGTDEGIDSNGTSTTGVIKDKNNDTIDSGFYKPTYNLGDYVWEDTNKNGVQDKDEKGISGVTVTLKDENDKVLKTVTTDENGKYQFTDLNNGTYKVEFETPSGYTPTSVTSGNDTEKDSNGLT